MKTSIKSNFLKSSVLMICFFVMAYSGYAANTVSVILQNCSSTSNTLNFDLILTNTSGSDNVLNVFQTGIDFNYDGIANGGAISFTYVAGSSELSSEHKKFNSVDVFIDRTTHELRITGQVVLSSSLGTKLANNAPIRIGTFQLMNTKTWTPSSSPSFSFNTLKSSLTRTKLLVGTYTNSAIATPAVVDNSIACNTTLNSNPATGIAPISGALGTLNAYPNPAHSKLNVDFSSDSKDVYLIKMYDVAGAVLIEQGFNASKGENHVELDLSNFAKGIYVLSFTSRSDSKKLSIAVE
jgi:hypothetical protein